MLLTATIGYDNSMMNGVQALKQWQNFMHNPKGAYLGGIFAVQAAGSCFGYPLMSILANKYGRKKNVYLGYCILFFGVGLQTSARNLHMFIASRFFVGLSSGCFGAIPMLITETAYPTHRSKLTAGIKFVRPHSSLYPVS
jgi:MFS family permease